MKPKRLFEEQSLVPQHEHDQMKLEILEEVLENALYYEQLQEIMEMVNEKLYPMLQARHLDLKEKLEK
jgi:hypothetical protein